jgi:hypothetical protein
LEVLLALSRISFSAGISALLVTAIAQGAVVVTTAPSSPTSFAIQTASYAQVTATGTARYPVFGTTLGETVQVPIASFPTGLLVSSLGFVAFSPDSSTATLTVSAVTDTRAFALTLVPTPIATYTFTTPNIPSLGYAELDLSGVDQLLLPATTGTAGYVFDISVNPTTSNLAIQQTGYGNDTYSGGGAYINNGKLFGVTEDYALTLVGSAPVSPVPEPASLSLLGLGAVALLKRRAR